MKQLVTLAASHRDDSLNRRLLLAAIREWQLFDGVGWKLTQEEYHHWDSVAYNDADRLAGIIPSQVNTLHERLLDMDAMLIAAPEYNWSYPGSLKNTLDWLSVFRPVALAGKPVFLCCATPSERGGIIGLTHLKMVLEGLGMHVFPAMFPLGKAHLALTTDGFFLDEDKRKRLADQLKAFIGFAQRIAS